MSFAGHGSGPNQSAEKQEFVTSNGVNLKDNEGKIFRMDPLEVNLGYNHKALINRKDDSVLLYSSVESCSGQIKHKDDFLP